MLAAALPDRLAIDVADAQALKARARSGDRESLAAAARQFESLMIAQMLKTMRETRFNSEDDPFTGGDSLKLYQGMLDQQWAASMAKGRGLGFADMLVKHLERQAGIVPDAASGMAKPVDAGDQAPETGLQPAPRSTLQAPPQPAPLRAGESTAPAWTHTPGAATSEPNWRRSVPDPGAAANPSSVEPAVSTPAAATPAVITPPADAAERKQRFLDNLRPHAQAAESATGVPARFILAQAALESGWGAREIKDGEGKASHNLFGIKAGKSWEGGTVETTTTEYRSGLPMKLTQSFRSYADYGAAFSDYASLLKARYGAALAAGDDAEGFANALAAGGYATDPAYAGKLKSVIASVANTGL